MIGVSELKPYGRNPRNNDKAAKAVAKSIKEFGFKVPLVVDRDGVIVCGHTRFKAAKSLGYKEVPCIVADDLSPAQINAFRLADNRVGELATWDEELLLGELEALGGEFDMRQFGFKDSEVSQRVAEADGWDEELPIIPRTKKGDLYLIEGGHRLLCGDSVKPEDMDRLMDGEHADMCFTDPPYNLAYEGNTPKLGAAARIANDSMPDESKFQAFLRDAFGNMAAALKPGAPVYVCHSDTHIPSFYTALQEAGILFKQSLVWVKNHSIMGRQDYQWMHEGIMYAMKPKSESEAAACEHIDYALSHERIYYGWKGGAPHYFTDSRTERTVWEFPKPNQSDLHPTMKPIELCGKGIANSSREGAIVLDPFGGSGSTMVACHQLGRRGYLMELSPRYCDAVCQRMQMQGLKIELVRNECREVVSFL